MDSLWRNNIGDSFLKINYIFLVYYSINDTFKIMPKILNMRVLYVIDEAVHRCRPGICLGEAQ